MSTTDQPRHYLDMEQRSKTGGTKGTNGARVKGAARQHDGSLRPEQRHGPATLSEIADLGGGSARRLREEAPGAPESEERHTLFWLAILALIGGAAAVIALVLALVVVA